MPYPRDLIDPWDLLERVGNAAVPRGCKRGFGIGRAVSAMLDWWDRRKARRHN